MKTVKGFRLRKLGNEHIVVPEGIELVNFNKMISLNESAAYLWESIEGKEFTAETLADLLVSQYEIERELALADSKNIVERWLEIGIIEN